MPTFTDTFDGAAPDLTWASARGSSLPVPNGDGTATISGSAWQYVRAEHNTGSADMYAEVRIDRGDPAGADRRVVLLLRASTGSPPESAGAVTLLGAVLSLSGRTLSFLQMEGSPAPVGGGPLAGDQPVTIPSVPFTFRVEAQGGTVRGFFDGQLVSEAAIRGTGPTGTYGGLGARELTAATVRYGEYRVGALSDPARPVVDAGADATLALGATFARTAGESGGAAASRVWSVVSGPAQAGVVLARAAALSWAPGAVGTYVLRYTATNATGSASDDVTVTVTAPAPSGPEPGRLLLSA